MWEKNIEKNILTFFFSGWIVINDFFKINQQIFSNSFLEIRKVLQHFSFFEQEKNVIRSSSKFLCSS